MSVIGSLTVTKQIDSQTITETHHYYEKKKEESNVVIPPEDNQEDKKKKDDEPKPQPIVNPEP